MNLLSLIGRTHELFGEDISKKRKELDDIISSSSFLVIGGAGSIGQATVKEIFKRNPKKIHIIDISENNMVELVRDIRSSIGYIEGDFNTFSLDVGSDIYDSFIKADGRYDYVLNFSALKHVRSEKDPFTLMRMIEVNILNTDKTLRQSIEKCSKKYFCVSTDKATNPVNMMGASKRVMEMFLMRRSRDISISTARFANVAFSDGSLLHGFNQRIQKKQPIVAPYDIKRYFLTPKESGELCLMSAIFGENRDIFFPKLDEKLHLITFATIAEKFLQEIGYEPYLCSSEDEARDRVQELTMQKKWPCLFSKSDTTGEKDFEEFFTGEDVLDMKKFHSIGVIKNGFDIDIRNLEYFEKEITKMKKSGNWEKSDILNLYKDIISNFDHKETGKYLHSKM